MLDVKVKLGQHSRCKVNMILNKSWESVSSPSRFQSRQEKAGPVWAPNKFFVGGMGEGALEIKVWGWIWEQGRA